MSSSSIEAMVRVLVNRQNPQCRSRRSMRHVRARSGAGVAHVNAGEVA
jgi:hypothetical protein